MNTEDVKLRLSQLIGTTLELSPWIEISQSKIDDFGRCTGDMQWIHIDPERAKRESPFGTTIAHGYLLLALLGDRCSKLPVLNDGFAQQLNYGLDKVRWIAPVKVGSRVRNRMQLTDVVDKGARGVLITTENTLEIEGEEKPAMIASWLVFLSFT